MPSSATMIRKSSRRRAPASIHMEKECSAWIATLRRTPRNGYIYGEVAAASRSTAWIAMDGARVIRRCAQSGERQRRRFRPLAAAQSDGQKRFEWRGGKLYQRSAVDPGMEWRVKLVRTPWIRPRPTTTSGRRAPSGQPRYAAAEWGADVPDDQLAHGNDKMECYSCHTSWTRARRLSPAHEANAKTERHHYEGGNARVYATYNRIAATTCSCWAGAATSMEGKMRQCDPVGLGRLFRPTPIASTSTSAASGLGERLQLAGVQSSLSATERNR